MTRVWGCSTYGSDQDKDKDYGQVAVSVCKS